MNESWTGGAVFFGRFFTVVFVVATLEEEEDVDAIRSAVLYMLPLSVSKNDGGGVGTSRISTTGDSFENGNRKAAFVKVVNGKDDPSSGGFDTVADLELKPSYVFWLLRLALRSFTLLLLLLLLLLALVVVARGGGTVADVKVSVTEYHVPLN